MAFLEESEWLFVNEIAYNISFIYSFDEMRNRFLEWIGKLIPYDCACFSLVKDEVVYNTVSKGINDEKIVVYEKLYSDNPLYWTLISEESFAYNQSDMVSADSVKDNIFYKKVTNFQLHLLSSFNLDNNNRDYYCYLLYYHNHDYIANVF